ncbi:MAG TPA: GPP34 family phosphoprotein [Candidatus Mediterraneibacter excrementigallinarum]|nr:GPP34 family phosphoprotein [Candidatus Mediterraneibacter excrementigallinarum]
MKDLSVTQQYLLCVLGKRGKFATFEIEKVMCLSTAGLLELLLDEIVELDDKKLSVKSALPIEKSYLSSIYNFIVQKQPVKFQKVIEYYSVTFTDRNINELLTAVGESLVQEGCAVREKGGIFGGKTVYIPDEKELDGVVQNIRAELLEEGELSEDIVALTALLEKSGDLMRYFSAYEKKSIRSRLKEIKESPQNEMIQKVSEYIDTLFMMFIVAAT